VWCGPHQLALLLMCCFQNSASYTGSLSGLYSGKAVQHMLLLCVCARTAVAAAACMLCSPSTSCTCNAMSWCTCCEYTFCMKIQVLPAEQSAKLCSMSSLLCIISAHDLRQLEAFSWQLPAQLSHCWFLCSATSQLAHQSQQLLEDQENTTGLTST